MKSKYPNYNMKNSIRNKLEIKEKMSKAKKIKKLKKIMKNLKKTNKLSRHRKIRKIQKFRKIRKNLKKELNPRMWIENLKTNVKKRNFRKKWKKSNFGKMM